MPSRRRCHRHRRSPRLRSAVVAAVAATVGALLVGGCGATADSAGPASSPSSTPRAATDRPLAGDCWQAPDPAAMRDWSWWQGDAPVDCDAEHVAITVDVVDLEDSAERPAPVDGRDELPDATSDLISQTCDAALGRTTPADSVGTRVEWLFYLPTWEQWEAGERWVRCDVAVVALGPTDGTGLEALPPTAAEVLDEARGRYKVCTDGPLRAEGEDYADVYARSAFVECDAAADWEFAFAFDLWQDEFPGDYARTLAKNYCEAHMARSHGERDGYTAYFPSEQSWAEGSRTVQCWLESSAAELGTDA